MVPRLGGLGQLWVTLRRLLSILFLSQLLSPLVAFIALFVSSTVSITTQTVQPSTGQAQQTTTMAPVILPTLDDTCCQDNTILHPCPVDHTPNPTLPVCQDPTTPCSSLPLSCLSCKCPYTCKYGAHGTASCSAPSQVKCSGERNFTREFLCSYCYLTKDSTHSCSTRDIGCRSVGSPTSKAHWYIANCTTKEDTICLGKKVFSKRKECNWTEGYSWRTACILSITLGGFGADRFYLGHWQEGIGKLFSFGGLGVWTLVDVVLVATGYIGPADGSLYV